MIIADKKPGMTLVEGLLEEHGIIKVNGSIRDNYARVYNFLNNCDIYIELPQELPPPDEIGDNVTRDNLFYGGCYVITVLDSNDRLMTKENKRMLEYSGNKKL